jgi:type I restriction enzyme M protein
MPAEFKKIFENVSRVLWKEAGCSSELDYTEQISWILFLKYLDDIESDKAIEAELGGRDFKFILEEKYRWKNWAAPKKEDESFDSDSELVGEDLIDFVNNDLFPRLGKFKQDAIENNTIQYKIGEIFDEIKNKFRDGYSMRDALDYIDELQFRSQKDRDELSSLYEDKIKNMGNAGRNGGEYYTPRPLIRAMIRVIDPKIGETIYDSACGSAGFLCESYVYLRHGKENLTTSDLKFLQEKTFFGKEKKSLAYIIGIMNMILHGIAVPNLIHTNTLTENLTDIQEKDRFDIILANPPFGGSERPEIKNNFTIKSGETAYLFLQHYLKKLRAGGRAAVVIKDTFLSNPDNASRSLRNELLKSCNVHSILDCPSGTFIGAGVKTVVLFFEKGSSTHKIWFYQLDPGRKMGKINSLKDIDLAEFIKFQKTFVDSEKSWTIDVVDVNKETMDLSIKNPNIPEEEPLRLPEEILNDMEKLESESAEILANIKRIL